jgi:integrase
VITLKDIAALSPKTTVWDEGKGAVTGFGARRQRSVAISYFLKYRVRDGRQRWHTIGRHGAPWTPDMARGEARRVLGEVAKGGDPSAEKQEIRKAATVGELCDAYREAAEAGRILTRRKVSKKPSTLDGDRGRIERHIKPLLGNLKVAAVTSADIERFRDGVSEGKTEAHIKTGKRGLARVTGGPGTATRAMGLLGAIFAFAVRRGLRADNPVRGVERHSYQERRRRLSDDEYLALGAALVMADAERIWPPAVSAARFLALTGWRRGEALGLTWSEIDLERKTATLGDTKTGRSVRPLSSAACDLLRAQSRIGVVVFPATRGGGPMNGFPKFWARIAKLGDLPADVTPHTLRHSFASFAGDLGYSEPTIAALIGHKGQSMTSRYVHAADAVLLAAADNVAARIAAAMGGNKGNDVAPRAAAGGRAS